MNIYNIYIYVLNFNFLRGCLAIRLFLFLKVLSIFFYQTKTFFFQTNFLSVKRIFMPLKRTHKQDLTFMKSLFVVHGLGIDLNHKSRMNK
jgi:hypothetical protein